jgi:hypothetical protein
MIMQSMTHFCLRANVARDVGGPYTHPADEVTDVGHKPADKQPRDHYDDRLLRLCLFERVT